MVEFSRQMDFIKAGQRQPNQFQYAVKDLSTIPGAGMYGRVNNKGAREALLRSESYSTPPPTPIVEAPNDDPDGPYPPAESNHAMAEGFVTDVAPPLEIHPGFSFLSDDVTIAA
jgi:hypothetical protein